MVIEKGQETALSSAEKGSNIELGQTAADSTTLAGEMRQSFGANTANKTGQLLTTDFTVAEDLHRCTAKEIGQVTHSVENRNYNNS